MAIGIAQGGLDAFGAQMMTLMPIETVTYRQSGLVTAQTQDITGRFVEYSQREKAANPLLIKARRFRTARQTFAADPPLGAILTQQSGKIWEITASDGGPGHAFWLLQCRQVG